MNVRGEIQVWTEGDKAHARIVASGKGGPVFLQVAAPLAEVRALMLRAVAAQGFELAGAPSDELIAEVGRRFVLRRLVKLAPGVFTPGGVATQLAVKAMRARGNRRRAVIDVPSRPAPVAHAAPGAGVEEEDDDETVEGVGFVGKRLRQPKVTPQVKAGAKLLNAAKRSPVARLKVKNIVDLAKTGNPKAQVALATLKTANKLRKGGGKRGSAPAAALRKVGPTKAVPTARTTTAAARTRRSRLFASWQRGLE